MKKIKFDIKYKDDIISGRYKLVYRDNSELRVLSWDIKGNYPICVIDENSPCPIPKLYRNDGIFAGPYEHGRIDGERYDDLFVLTDDDREEGLYKATLKDIVRNIETHYKKPYTDLSYIDEMDMLLKEVKNTAKTTLKLGERLGLKSGLNS